MSTKIRPFPSPVLFVLAMALCAGVGLPAQAGVDHWTPLGPMVSYSNDIGVVAVHPAAPGTLWTSLPQGGLYRSRDRGVTWRWVGQPFASADVDAVAADPSRPGALWAATSLSVFHTEDGGNRWVRLTGDSYIAALGGAGPTAMMTVPGTLYVVSSRRLLASRDNGRTWEILYDIGEAGWIQAFATHPAAPKRLYLVIYGPEHPDLLRSVDSGHAWASLPQPFPAARLDRLAVTTTAVYVSDSGSEGGLFRSTDGGRTWPEVTGKPGAPFAVHSWTLDPQSPQTLYVYGPATDAEYSEHALWVSRNAGQTWRKLGRPPIFPGGIVADSAAGALYATDFEQLARSLEGWTPWSEDGRWAQKLEVDPADPSKVYALTFLIDVVEPPHEPLAGLPSILWKSEDSGRTWRKIALNLRAFAFDRSRSRLYGVRNRDVLASDDRGKTWKTVARTPQVIHDLVIDPEDPDIFYVAGPWVSRSTDRGATWALLGGQQVYAYSLTLNPVDPRTLYAADRWGVFEITNPKAP